MSHSKIRLLLKGLFVIAVLAYSYYVVYNINSISIDENKTGKSVGQWQVLAHETSGIQFSYPPNWVVGSNSSKLIQFWTTANSESASDTVAMNISIKPFQENGIFETMYKSRLRCPDLAVQPEVLHKYIKGPDQWCLIGNKVNSEIGAWREYAYCNATSDYMNVSLSDNCLRGFWMSTPDYFIDIYANKSQSTSDINEVLRSFTNIQS